MYDLIIIFLFCMVLLQFIIAFGTIQYTFGYSSLLLGVTSFLILFPWISVNLPVTIYVNPAFLKAGISLFPVSYGLFIHFNIKPQEHRYLVMYLFLSFLFAASLYAAPQYSMVITVLFCIGFLLYTMYQLSSVTNLKFGYNILYISILTIILLNIVPLYTGEITFTYHTIVILNLITFSTVIYNFAKRSSYTMWKIRSIRNINSKLIHTITLLKQKNDQFRQIIHDKDMELLQISRHASLAELTAGIAHEMAQPLTGIKGIAQNMMDDINYDEFDNMQAVSELLKICSMVDKATTIIEHIRNFSKRSSFNMKYTDLNRVILDAIDLIRIQLRRNDIDIILSLDEDIKKIYGDPISLEQLILNIVINARDAILEHTTFQNENYKGKIIITTASDEESNILTIEDNGPGIPREVIKNIWSPFFSTKRKTNSLGIGLSISNKILREHNASVIVNSSEENIYGTKFIITFPLKRDNQVISVP